MLTFKEKNFIFLYIKIHIYIYNYPSNLCIIIAVIVIENSAEFLRRPLEGVRSWIKIKDKSNGMCYFYIKLIENKFKKPSF